MYLGQDFWNLSNVVACSSKGQQRLVYIRTEKFPRSKFQKWAQMPYLSKSGELRLLGRHFRHITWNICKFLSLEHSYFSSPAQTRCKTKLYFSLSIIGNIVLSMVQWHWILNVTYITYILFFLIYYFLYLYNNLYILIIWIYIMSHLWDTFKTENLIHTVYFWYLAARR